MGGFGWFLGGWLGGRAMVAVCGWVGKLPHLQHELGVVVEASHSALEHFDLDQLLLLHRVLVSVRVRGLTTP